MKKLSSYLSAGIAATATFQSSDAATIVTFYGPGARNESTNPATPAGISMGNYNKRQYLDSTLISNKSFFGSSIKGLGNYIDAFFTSGSDLKIGDHLGSAQYTSYGKLAFGAQSGSANYANISFDGNDGVYEAVGQFNLDGLGGGYLVALAINNSPASALSISAGKAAIDAVPEPSAIALLALGAGGMAMRRRRKVA